MLRKVRVVCNVVGGCLLSAALFMGEASALEPEHEVRRLMLATEAAVGAENWGEASEYLTRLQQMESEKPADYLYFRGRVMLESGHFNEARSAFEGYVSRAGSEGEHYTRALEMITRVEKARKNEQSGIEQATQPGSEPVAVIEPAGEGTLQNLRELYLADSDTQALVMHLNSLLDNAGWRPDERVKRLDRPADITYRVNRMNDALNIQEARREIGGRVTRSTESMNVFGINPSIDWNCEPAASACWIYDPRDGSRLMQLAERNGDAAEIARTLGKLIRTMQSRN
ncbi:tetratricopeptide repeat protein [Marinobacter confluentis]|uniref:Tetratricopeptide repeat protein n=1 Tax=Marinobacter confluentis TaxID=1697557 RepID=A0A4Z1CH41_9GAMM|nr:hypothetical protein [Marinobacter confluentis]TGN39852.1 hypothetical protein E5Q11_05980 [Marinobacter confluentis]